MKRVFGAVILSAFMGSSAVMADGPKDPVQEQVHYRQSLFTLVGHHMGKMGAVMKGKMDYDAATISDSANVLAVLSAVAHEGFKLESAVAGSEALPDIWKKPEMFNKIMGDFVTATAELAKNAGTEAGFKQNFPAVGKTCKGCHNKFKE